jgi:high-affinity Fe2+/Pb2+ permease
MTKAAVSLAFLAATIGGWLLLAALIGEAHEPQWLFWTLTGAYICVVLVAYAFLKMFTSLGRFLWDVPPWISF